MFMRKLARLLPALALATGMGLAAPIVLPDGAAAKPKVEQLQNRRIVRRGEWQPLAGKRRRGKRTHYIEFRARHALSYGHTSVVLGKLDSKGRVPRSRSGVLRKGTYMIAGLHPKSDSPAVYSLGHVVPVPAATGWSDGDDEDAYQLAKYRIDLTRSEYNQIRKLVRRRQKASKFWHAVGYACVHFTNDIAKDIGLKTPFGLYLPERWVKALARTNGRTGKLWARR